MQVLPSSTTPQRSVADQWTESSCLEECFDAADGVDPTRSTFDSWTSSCCGKLLPLKRDPVVTVVACPVWIFCVFNYTE